jgi:hypothetical protein
MPMRASRAMTGKGLRDASFVSPIGITRRDRRGGQGALKPKVFLARHSGWMPAHTLMITGTQANAGARCEAR